MKMSNWLSLCIAIAVITFAVGCKKDSQQAGSNETQPTASNASDHHHGAGPNGGAIADWGGGKYHVEFTVDHDKKQATVYILGSDAKSPAPVKAKELILSINDPAFEVTLKPEPLEGEPEGSSSRFVGQHDNLGVVQEFAGSITGEVEGTPYAGDFKEEPAAANE